MPQYSEEYRERSVQMMMAPNAITVAQVSRDISVSEQTLYNWRNRLRHQGVDVPADPKITFTNINDQGVSGVFGEKESRKIVETIKRINRNADVA
jgi:transposase-like protein